MNNLFNKLDEIINNYDKFIIMGHKNPDLDVLGSALGLYSIIEKKGKECFIFLDISNENEYNSTVIYAIDNIKNKIKFINNDSYKKYIDEKTLLIVVDVHQIDRLEYPKILDSKVNTIVLDHHMKSHNYIKETKFSYIDTNLSSMTELITNYAKSLNINFDSITSTIMLAGIEIDTNGYNLRTTERTYNASAILMSMGADTVLKQELLKETIDDYLQKADIIKTSFMINDNTAMCIFTNKCKKERLAEVADELLKFVDVEVSFVIGKLDYRTIGVSARSLGNYNVEEIIKQLGGGGHETTAAAQIKNSTVKEIKQKIINLVG